MPGFNKDHQAYLLLSFSDAARARGWLAAIQWDLASAAEVRRNRDIYRRQGAARATWVNLGVSYAGLRLLVPQGVAQRFPATFRRNQVPLTSATRFTTEVHALLIGAADEADDLGSELDRQRERLVEYNVREVGCFRGAVLPGALRGHEHFGFKDAISQPRISGTDWGLGPDVAPGEFVFGYPDQTGRPSGSNLPAWVQNGSFVAFVQLEQHVATFWNAMHRLAQHLELQPHDLAAWIVGRDANGNPLSDQPSRICHIGRAYSRWQPDALRHRILRRGIPYGPPLAEGQPDDGQERGLFFLAYQSDLERQFEHVWTRWLNSHAFPTPGSGNEALVGQIEHASADARRGVLVGPPGTAALPIATRLPEFVTPHYAAYFFAPSIVAVSSLLDRGRS